MHFLFNSWSPFDGTPKPTVAEFIREGRSLEYLPASMFLRATRAECDDAMGVWEDHLRSRAAAPFGQRLGVPYPAKLSEIFNADRYEMVSAVLTDPRSVSRVQDELDAMTMERRVVEVMLALEGYENEHGSLPIALDSLVPAFLDVIPADTTYGSTTGVGLGYLQVDSPSWHGQPYLLYSLGRDGLDQDGAVDPHIFSPFLDVFRSREGYDVILNLTKETWGRWLEEHPGEVPAAPKVGPGFG